MTEKDDIKSVLSELRKVLSDLKKEEITPEQEPTKEPDLRSQQTQNLSKKTKSVPILKRPGKIPVPAQPRTQTQGQIPEKQPEISIETSAKVEQVTKQDISEEKPSFPKPEPHEQKKEQPEIPVEAKSKPVKEEPIPEDKNLLQYALIYPFGQENPKESFSSNFAEVIKKTVKKPFVPYCVFDEPVNPSDVNWEEIIRKCQDNKINALFLVYSLECDYTKVKDRFNSVGIFFQPIHLSQLNKKMTYVDLAIELILSKG